MTPEVIKTLIEIANEQQRVMAVNCTHYSGQKDLHTLQKLDSACNADPHSWTGVFSDSFIMDTCISHRVSPA